MRWCGTEGPGKLLTGLAVVLIAVVSALLTGCGTGFAVPVHPQTGTMVECRENLFDGITDTIGRCVEAYEQAGFVVRGRR
jgi:hypothetical protein